MKELQEKFSELKSIILKSKKFDVRKDFHLFILLEEISSKIDKKVTKWLNLLKTLSIVFGLSGVWLLYYF